MVDLYGTCIRKYTSPMDAVEICLLYTCNAAIHLSSQIFTLVEQLNIQEEYSHIGAFTQKQELETYIINVGTILKSVPFDAISLLVMLSLPVVPVTFSGRGFAKSQPKNLHLLTGFFLATRRCIT